MRHDLYFSGVRRAEHQAALTKAERSDQVDQPHIREGFPVLAFQGDPAARISRGQFIKGRPGKGFLLRNVVDARDIEQGGILVSLALGSNLAADHIAGPETEPADLSHGNIDILGGWLEGRCAEETVSVRMQLKDPAAFFKITGGKEFFQRRRLDPGFLSLDRGERFSRAG